MSKGKNKSDASHSFLGYLYQMERAIEWLISLKSSDAVVGIEVHDDICIALKEGKDIDQIYEQAKHSIGSKSPYADRSEDLWKTLSIWFGQVIEKNIDPNKTIFSLVSNKIIPADRFVWKLHKATKGNGEEINQVRDQLKSIAKTLRTGLNKYGNVIETCPNDTCLDIISNIQVIDTKLPSESEQSRSNRIRDELHVSKDVPANYLIERLRGYILSEAINNWRNRRPCWITVSAFNKQLTDLIGEYQKTPFIERAIELLPVSDKEIAKNKKKTFIKQLTLIDCDENEILEAVHDYFRHCSELDRLAFEGEISREAFELYYNQLHSNWDTISKPKFKYFELGKEVQTGYEVYYETLKFRGKIKGYEPVQNYTYRGAYHSLANELRLGWHPKWQTCFIKNED